LAILECRLLKSHLADRNARLESAIKVRTSAHLLAVLRAVPLKLDLVQSQEKYQSAGDEK